MEIDKCFRQHSGKIPTAVIFCTLYCENLHSSPNYYFSETIFDIVLERAFLVVQIVKNLPVIQETWFSSLDQEDRLEKRMATHSSILG